MSALKGSMDDEMSTMPPQHERPGAQKYRSVVSCNFRSAGRLSNEDARRLTAIHESFAQLVSSALDAAFGTSCEVKLEGFDQRSLKEHVAAMPAQSLIVPLVPNAAFLEFETDLAFLMVELLLGGAGSTHEAERELSEIDEEIMANVVALIQGKAASSWLMPDLSQDVQVRIRAAEMLQGSSPNEKATVLRFSVQLANMIGSFRIVLLNDFLNSILKQGAVGQGHKKARLKSFPMPPLRERILDCDIEITSELAMLRVAVRDLISLQPGSVLKLHAPIRNPSTLTSGGYALFEAAPVRIGSQRAVQLGRSVKSLDREGR